MSMDKVTLQDGQSADIISENLEKLKELFPDAFTEGGVNFDVLRQLLGDASVLDEGEEKYGLNWHGKKKARQIALTPSTGTLLPCPEESVDWDTTQNLFIEGDNLEVLKLLQKSYAGQVKQIYIDPPNNTGKEFVYPDRFQDNLDTYLKYTGQVDSEGMKFASNTEAGGRKHTNWLNMMLPRLRLAKNLLKKDGAIFVSCDENEQTRLRAILDEVFGNENFVADLVWAGGRKNDSKLVSVSHEYIVCYARDMNFLRENKVLWRQRKKGLDEIYAQYE
jgi:adenine-specific DNA-methyltransferase